MYLSFLTIRSLGGEVSWDRQDAAGSTYQETDDSITHQLVDRPSQTHRYLSRYFLPPSLSPSPSLPPPSLPPVSLIDLPVSLLFIFSFAKLFTFRIYIQPQWIYDSINFRHLLPVSSYTPGATLPPHLSPFVEEGVGDYVPPDRVAMMDDANVEKEDRESELDSVNDCLQQLTTHILLHRFSRRKTGR